ncbi:MAG: hypothetical protein NTX45_02175 [Proteobacteria bacterium]|nr:hypothetical protein [Pseudomonadota bacterium]
MTNEQEQLLIDIGQLAADYRASCATGDNVGQARIAKVYLDKLAQLSASDWDSPLGEANELPDDLMPQDYLAHRNKILSDLEDRLAYLAMRYRSSLTEAASEEAVADYHVTMNEMYRIGHWVGVPDLESELPDELMPPVFHERVRQLIAKHREKQQGLGNPLK